MITFRPFYAFEDPDTSMNNRVIDRNSPVVKEKILFHQFNFTLTIPDESAMESSRFIGFTTLDTKNCQRSDQRSILSRI